MPLSPQLEKPLRAFLHLGAPLLVLVQSLTLLVGCGLDPVPPDRTAASHPPSAVDPASRANVIIVSIDTLRADRLSAYGYPRATSPTISALATNGVRFASALTEAPWTLPAHMTLMSGLHPRTHGATRLGRRLPDEFPTLAEVLQRNGYRTFAYTTGGFVGSVYGFGRGFETYFEQLRPFSGLVKRAINEIEGLEPDESYFLFLQTFAVHCPYLAPPKFAREFVTVPPEDRIDTAERCSRDYLAMDLSESQTRFLAEMYDAGIRYADEALNELVGFLLSRSAFRDTILVLLSDHGEEFGEHGSLGHGHTLYEEALRVPLVILAPGLSPRVVESRVGLIDVMPTLLELLEIDPPAMQGRSLVPLLRGASDPHDRAHFAETTSNGVHLQSITAEGHKLIANAVTGEDELFDLTRDPREQTNLATEHPDRTRALRKRLDEHFAGLVAPPESPAQPGPQNLEQLRALGYID